MNVYLDEYAHVRDDVKIYTAALPVISKGEGRRLLRVGSSPMGASGRFWEIFEQKLRQYPGYTRKRTPWWQVWAFCDNVAEAIPAGSGFADGAAGGTVRQRPYQGDLCQSAAGGFPPGV